MAELDLNEMACIPIDDYMRTNYQKRIHTFKLSVGDAWKIPGRVCETKFSSFSTSDNVCKIKKYGDKDTGDILLVEIISSEEIQCEIFVSDPDGKLLKTTRAKSYHHIEFHYLFNLFGVNVERLMISKNYDLTVVGVIRIIKRNEITEICSYPHRCTPAFDYMKRLADRLRSLEENFLDDKIYLKAQDGKELVNKSIICAISPVFAELLKDTAKKVVTIDGVSTNALKCFVHFLYTGLIPDGDFETLCQLYKTGHAYKISELQNICGDNLWSRLTVQNVCELYLLSDSVEDELLKAHLKKFVLVYFDKIIQTTGWQALFLQNPKLALDIINSYDSQDKTIKVA